MITLQRQGWLRGLLLLVVLWLPVTLSWGNPYGTVSKKDSEVAYKASQYKRLLISYASVHWPMGTAPIPLLAAQIHQESRWNPLARSKYACGLTQFTPETALWISNKYKVNVGAGVCTDVAWAIKAQTAYMRWLELHAISRGATDCDRKRFALWGYNGGLGWVQRDKALAASKGGNPLLASSVAGYNAGRGKEFFAENRDYDIMILIKWQPLYDKWGSYTSCF